MSTTLDASSTSSSTSSSCNIYVDLFSCASLKIAEEDWNSLVNSDVNLAVHVGLLLLRNNKELERVLEATERQYEEQKMRADHCENQVKNLNMLLNSQGKTYTTLEHQIEDLTTKYKELFEDCYKYREKNKALWGRVESLERDCEEYLDEIELLKDQTFWLQDDKNNKSPERKLSQHKVSLSRRLSNNTEQAWPVSLLEKVMEENRDLKQKIETFEEQLNEKEENNKCRLRGVELLQSSLSESAESVKIPQTEQSIKTKYFTSCSENLSEDEKFAAPTVRHYHELFAEIFAKLETTREKR